jgi:hypothetical protein
MFFQEADDFTSLNALAAIDAVAFVASEIHDERLERTYVDPVFDLVVRPSKDLGRFANGVPLLKLDRFEKDHRTPPSE